MFATPTNTACIQYNRCKAGVAYHITLHRLLTSHCVTKAKCFGVVGKECLSSPALATAPVWFIAFENK